MQNRDLIAIGASAGGFVTLHSLLVALPAGLPASVLVAMHINPRPNLLAPLFDDVSALPVENARHGAPYQCGHVYLAPPDRHLLVGDRHLHLSAGARENGVRPAINPLLRSAAVARGPRVIAVVLTGMLDDGTIGMQAVHRCGGICIVQDPADAAYPEMPRSVLAGTQVDHCVPLAELAPLLVRLVHEPAGPAPEVPEDLRIEVRATLTLGDNVGELEHIGTLSPFTCPECGGSMWTIRDGGATPHYRCHTGHTFSEQALALALTRSTEQALWVALRTLEERTRMLHRLATTDRSGILKDKITESEAAARELRRLLIALADSAWQPDEPSGH